MPEQSLREEIIETINIWNAMSSVKLADSILSSIKKRLPAEHKNYVTNDDEHNAWLDGYNQYRKKMEDILDAK